MAAGRAPPNLELAELDKKETARLNRKLSQLNKDLVKWIKQGEDFLDMVGPNGPKVIMKTGEFPQKTYTEGSINPQSSAPIACLPNELTVIMVNGISNRADQIALALTCKRFAKMDVLHRAQILEKNKNGGVKQYSKIYKLEIMIRLKSWMPPTHHLCYYCLKYKPRNKAGWQTNMEITDGKFASHKAINEGPKCPKCTDWLALQRGKELQEFKRLSDRVKNVVKKG